MAWPLAPHVHVAVLGEDVVLLDLLQGAYLCLPSGRALLRPSSDRRSLHPADEAVADELLEVGVLALHAAPLAPPPGLPTAHVLDIAGRRPSGREIVRLGLCLWDLGRAYWGRRLGRILAFADARGRRLSAALVPERDPQRGLERDPGRGPESAPEPAPEASERARELGAVFQRAAVWLPISRKCLVRSFVLLRFLQRSGVRARWVLGVRTWPFSAHCWVQHGGVVLDDAAERLVVYEPIVAVG
jgi:hypothetical protein